MNNAYGLQSPSVLKKIDAAILNGRIDVLVSSTDKNFMVPVGGSIIYATDKSIIK